MGENLKKFIELFDARATEGVAKAKTKLDNFTKVRGTALDLKTPVNDKYKTLGELVKDLIPENGMLNDDLFKSVYANLSLNKEDKAVVSELFKLKSAPNSYEKAVSVKEKGGAFYLNELMREIGKTMASANLSFEEVIGKNAADFSKFLNEGLENLPEGPVESSNPSLYAAVIENGNPLKKKEEASSAGAINEPSTKKEAAIPPTPTTSAVNPEKAAESTKTEVESTTGQVTSVAPEVPAELEKKQEKSAININVEAPVAPTTVAKAPEQTTIVNQGGQSTTNVQNVTTSNKEEVTQTQNTIAPSTTQTSVTGGKTSNTQTNVTGGQTTSQINDMSSKKVEGASSSITNVGKSLTSQITELGKQLGFSEKQLGQIAKSQTLNATTEVSKKTELITEKSKTSEQSTINEGEEEAKLETGKTEPTINEVKPAAGADSGKYAALVEAAKRYGINVDSMKPTASPQVEEPEGNEEITTKKEALPQTVEVSKTKQSLPKETKVEPVAQKSLEVVQNPPQQSIEAVEKPTVTKEEASATEPKSDAQTTSSKLDLSGLESRLMRIEHLLANTLEVKIVE